MPTYFDPITQEDTLLDENTSVYLVKISDDTFSIKGISSGLEKLPGDPTTQATEYWSISIKTLMDLKDNKVLFEEDKLTSKPLSLEQVIKFFDFDPNQVKPNQFDSSIKERLKDDWVQQTMQDLLGQGVPNRATFFYRPIFIQELPENHNQQEEQSSNRLIPAIAVFNMIPQSMDNEGEGASRILLQMFIVIMNQEEVETEEYEENSTHNLH